MLEGYGIENVHYTITSSEYGNYIASPGTTTHNQFGVNMLRGILSMQYGNNAHAWSYTLNSPMVGYVTTLKQQPGYSNGYFDLVREELPSENRYWGELSTLYNETRTKMILGDLSIDEWDSYVNEWLERGGEVLTKEAAEWYDAR